jgi:hypothetical protein
MRNSEKPRRKEIKKKVQVNKNMPQEYTKEEFWKLYERLPQELKDTIFSGETADHIRGICERYNVDEKNIPEVAKQIGNVFLGLLPPENFQNVLELELKLEKETIEKMMREINRFVFYPVKPVLEQLYGTIRIGNEETPTGAAQEKPKRTAGEDRYRETIE